MKRILLTAAILTAATMSYAQPRYECHRAIGPLFTPDVLELPAFGRGLPGCFAEDSVDQDGPDGTVAFVAGLGV